MPRSLKTESTEYTDLNIVIIWFITLRWIACLGVLAALLMVNFIFIFNLPFLILYLLNALLIIINLTFTVYYYYIKKHNLSHKETSVFLNIQVCIDYLILFLIIYFTGFLENPFSIYFVFHIMLTSFVFSRRLVFIYAGILFSVIIAVSLGEYYHLIPHFSLSMTKDISTYYNLIFIRSIGLCSALIIAAYLITSIKLRLEERGKRVEVELKHYKSLDKIKSNFILQVTHELRGPLAALKGYIEMVLKGITGEIKPKTKEKLQKADHRTENLLTIIDEMIDFAYMKSEEELKYNKTDIRIKEIIDYNIDLLKPRANFKGIKLVSSCQKDILLNSNRDLLHMILNNLITNAIKYSLPKTTVTISVKVENEVIHIIVEDQGIGINPDELENIFEDFYRTRRAREMEKDGTGLGLSIVKRAVNALNGNITIYSAVGKGTILNIYLPR